MARRHRPRGNRKRSPGVRAPRRDGHDHRRIELPRGSSRKRRRVPGSASRALDRRAWQRGQHDVAALVSSLFGRVDLAGDRLDDGRHRLELHERARSRASLRTLLNPGREQLDGARPLRARGRRRVAIHRSRRAMDRRRSRFARSQEPQRAARFERVRGRRPRADRLPLRRRRRAPVTASGSVPRRAHHRARRLRANRGGVPRGHRLRRAFAVGAARRPRHDEARLRASRRIGDAMERLRDGHALPLHGHERIGLDGRRRAR